MIKKKRLNISDKDISFRITYRKGFPYVNIIFRNNVGNLAADGKNFITTFVENERVYFEGNDTKHGSTKISHINKNTDYMLTCTADKCLIEFVKHHSDNYDLKYDCELKMYYVEAKEKRIDKKQT